MRRAMLGSAGIVLMLAGAALGLYGILALWFGGGWSDASLAAFGLGVLVAGLVSILCGNSLLRRADRFGKPS